MQKHVHFNGKAIHLKWKGEEKQDVNTQWWNISLQNLIGNSKISAGHDVSDGGLIVALLEMAFAGNCGFELILPTNEALHLSDNVPIKNILFSEELGQVMEVSVSDVDEILEQ